MLGLSALAAFLLDEDRIPNEEAIALSPLVGWLMFAGALALAVFFVLHHERWRRWWLGADDPRAMGLFRIVFAFFVLANVNGLWEHFIFLFTDEGIFPADIARQVHASGQFAGFGDGFSEDEPWGFFDWKAFLVFMEGPKYSFLFFWDSPTAWWIHLAAFELSGFLLLIGLWSRVTAVSTFLLMNSIFLKNHLFWEGTDLVYRCFLFYLLLARSGHAYSVDNWLRCRRLRKQGRLSELDGPGQGAGLAPCAEHPKGLEPIYRPIPSWPRRLMILQLAAIYTTTGILKNGGVWTRGDALYYALNMDHFYRFYPQWMSSIFGTNMLRVMTWVTHWWEVFFPVVVVGMVVRWSGRQDLPPLAGVRLWVARACWLVVAGTAGAVIFVTWPVHSTPCDVEYFVAAWVVFIAGLGYLWWRFARKPFRVRTLFRLRPFAQPITLDLDWFCRWFLGRRIWLVLSIVFQAHVFILMNIGQFQTGMMAAAITYLSGREAAAIVGGMGALLQRLGARQLGARLGEISRIPEADRRLPAYRPNETGLPEWAFFAGLGFVVTGIVARIFWMPKGWTAWWTAGLVFLAGVGFVVVRRAKRQAAPSTEVTPSHRPRLPLAYGPVGRLLIGSLVLWHTVGVTLWLLPEKDCLSSWRINARNLFSKWFTLTQTDQGWGMFAPNPPQSNVFLKVLVYDKAGEVWDLRTDVYAAENKPIPWIWNDRMRKMNRRIGGGESGPNEWYRRWFIRYHCRQWALTHGGESPKKVALVKMWYQIPSPEQVRDLGWYVPEDLFARSKAETELVHEECESAIVGQLPNEIRERHGLPLLPSGAHKPWIKNKKRSWERKAAEPSSFSRLLGIEDDGDKKPATVKPVGLSAHGATAAPTAGPAPLPDGSGRPAMRKVETP